ncbi:MAG: ABC transporter substrate-binding protein [Hyphomicrobiaceae bacterium]
MTHEFDPNDLDRRQMLRLAAVMGGVAAFGGLLPDDAVAQDAGDASKITVVNEKYMRLYKQRKNFLMNDPGWVKETLARITWPKEGTEVPEFGVLVQTANQDWIDAWRKFAADAEKVGLKYNVQTVSQSRYLEAILTHRHGDVEVHRAVPRPERLDPAEWLVSRAYGLDRRNYGEWTNEQYDAEIEAQAKATSKAKRMQHVHKAQAILADDLYITQFGWGPQAISAYNSGAFDGAKGMTGFALGDFNMFQTYLGLKPKTRRKRVIVGAKQLYKTINIIGASNRFRAVGRMIYDRLAYLDEKLNVIPWAAESWKQVDDRTFDIKLRPGMKFHDGKPVTIHDLKFTFDFMLKYDRGFFWTTNRYLKDTKIQDEAAGVLRVSFKEPYGPFEDYFLILNVILPKHIWEGIMEKQKVSDARQLRIDKPIGSGPFKFGRYRKDTESQLIANKEHFSKPVIDEVVIVVVPSVDGIIGRMQSGEIDFMDGVELTPSQAAQLKSAKHISVVRSNDVNWLHGVTRISWLPWRDYEFRRAWHHTFDRSFLVNTVWEGAARVPKSNTFLVEGNPWHNPNLPAIPPFDLAKAREILKAAGYSWNSNGRLVYPSAKNEAWKARVRKVVKDGYTWGGIKMIES